MLTYLIFKNIYYYQKSQGNFRNMYIYFIDWYKSTILESVGNFRNLEKTLVGRKLEAAKIG